MKRFPIVFAASVFCLVMAACAPGSASPPPEEAGQAAFAAGEPTAQTQSAPAPLTEALPEDAAPPPETEPPEETTPPSEETAPLEADNEPLEAPAPLQAAVTACATAEKTEQIVLAVDHELTFWEKGPDGAWQKRMEAYCGYGKNGLVLGEERIMGSKTTPIGAFPLTLAFGTGESADTEMTYRKITENSYWSEAEDESFNTWVESETPVTGEHLIDYCQYKYAVNIGFNLEDVVYSRGSAIFLHCKSNDHWYTAGCVSLSEEDMLALLLMLRDGAYMIIVPDAESIGDY